MSRKKRRFKDYSITFRNPKSFHLFHKEEGITKSLIKTVLKENIEVKKDPRKLRKNIKTFYTTYHLTPYIRLTILFQIFPKEKRLHVLNAYLGSFHRKNLFEKLGLKEIFPKKKVKK